MLEYDLARAIARVIDTNKPVVGVMTPLPMFGMQMNPMMMRMGQQPPGPVGGSQRTEARLRCAPDRSMDTDKIDDDSRCSWWSIPRNISDKAQFAIDQFVLRGGKLLAFLDADVPR